MKTEKDNYKFNRSTFDKVHASDELVGKVKNMTKTEAKKKMFVFVYKKQAPVVQVLENV